MTYLWRSLGGADTPQWSRLLDAAADVDGSDERYSADDLAEELADPDLDADDDTVAVLAPDGDLAAAGQVLPPAERADGGLRTAFWGTVHPDHRGRGLGTALLRRLENRTRQVAAERFPGRPASPSTGAPPASSGARLLAAHGYRPIRYFHGMVAALHAPAAAADSRVVPYDPRLDAAVRQAHLAAFATHWRFGPPSEQRWQTSYTGTRAFRPGCSVLAGSAGRVDGYVLTYEYQPGEAYIGQVGVRPEARGRGLARAMLRAVLHAAEQAGHSTVALHVDSANADGAGALYASTGLRLTLTHAVFERP